MRNYGLTQRRAVTLTPLEFASGEFPPPRLWENLDAPPRRFDWKTAGLALAVCGPITALLVFFGLYRTAAAFGVAAWILAALIFLAGVL